MATKTEGLIVAQAAWRSLLILSGTFGQLVDYTGFAVVLFAGIAVTGLFVLRRREPGAARPFRAWGYPVAPAVSFSPASPSCSTLVSSPGPSAAGLAIIGLGVPVYFVLRRMRSGSSENH